jgi:hypothetical protein
VTTRARPDREPVILTEGKDLSRKLKVTPQAPHPDREPVILTEGKDLSRKLKVTTPLLYSHLIFK